MAKATKQFCFAGIFCLVFTCLGLFLAGSVFALELNYPSLPGIGGLQSDQSLGYYIRYILNLFFYISAGACVLVILFAGFLYVSGGQKTTTVIKARQYFRRGVIGLLILLASGVVLFIINPQLLLLKLSKQDIKKGRPYSAWSHSPEQIVVQEAPPLTLSKAILESLGQKVYRNNAGRFLDEQRYLTDGYGNYIDESGNYLSDGQKPILGVSGPIAAQNFVYRAEIPFIEIEAILGRAVEIIEGKKDVNGNIVERGLEDLLKDCKCGLSDYNITWGAATGGKCEPGLSDEDEKACQDAMYAAGDKPKSGKNQCRVKCGGAESAGDCGEFACGDQRVDEKGLPDKGGFLLCDTRQVKETRAFVDIGGEKKWLWLTEVEVEKDLKTKTSVWKYLTEKGYWRPIGWKPSAGWSLVNKILTLPTEDENGEPINQGRASDSLKPVEPADKVRPERLIRCKVLELVKLQAELDGHKQRFFPEQLGFVGKSLNENKIAFLLSNVKGGLFNYDFLDFKNQAENQGYEVLVKPFIDTNQKANPLSSSIEKPGLWAYLKNNITTALIPQTSAQDAADMTSAYSSASMFFITHASSAVTDEATVEANQFILREASRFSLFSVLTGLTIEKIEQIFQECLTAAFGAANYQLSEKALTSVIDQSIDEGAAAHFEAVLNSKLDEMSKATAGGIEQVIKNDKELEQELKSRNIPPHFVSETIAKVFSTKLQDVFPIVGETLNKQMRALLFEQGGTIDIWLDKDTLELYDVILAHSLTTSFASMQDGFIQKILDKEMNKILPEIVVDGLNQIDSFLECTIEGCCKETAIRDVAKIEGGVGDCCSDKTCRDEYGNNYFCVGGSSSNPNCDPSAPSGSCYGKAITGSGTGDCCQDQDCPANHYCIGGSDVEPSCDLQGGAASGSCYKRETEGVEVKIQSGNDCKGSEVFKEVGGVKMCCIEGMKKWIKRHSEDYIKNLVRQYIEEPFSNWAQGKIVDLGLSAEHIPINECYQQLGAGYIFEFTNNTFNQPSALSSNNFDRIRTIPDDKEMSGRYNVISAPSSPDRRTGTEGLCQPFSLEEINDLTSPIWAPEVEFIDIGNVDSHLLIEDKLNNPNFIKTLPRYIAYQQLSPAQKPNLCRSAGYEWSCSFKGSNVWDGFAPTDNCACVDANDLTQDVSGALSAAQDIKKTGQSFARGLINYGEQMVIAIIETALHTAIEYAKVFVEDSVISPFRASFNKIVNFQKNIRTFLSSTLEAAMPDEIAEVLQSNIDKQIIKVCDAFRNGEVMPGTCFPDESEEVCDMRAEVTFQLPSYLSWDGQQQVGGSFTIKKEAGKTFCGIASHLHSTIFEELSKNETIKKALTTTLVNELNHAFCDEVEGQTTKCVEAWLNQSLAELIWPGITGIMDLIRGTPEKLLCGKIVKKQGNDWLPAGESEANTIFNKCNSFKKTVSGILPIIDYDKFNQEVSSGDAGVISSWCHFIYSACQNPLAPDGKLGMTMGALIEQLFTSACDFINQKIEQATSQAGGQQECRELNPEIGEIQTLSDELKYSCRGCQSIVYNSLAEGLFYWAVRADIGPVSDRTEQERKDEREIYKWLLSYFAPSSQNSALNLEAEIKAVAEKRGLGSGEPDGWQSIKAEWQSNVHLNNFSEMQEYDFLMALLSWRMGSTPPFTGATYLKDIIFQVPFNVLKPFEQGQDALLVDDSSHQQNFLYYSPYQLLTSFYCPKIESAFAKEKPGFTLEGLTRIDRATLSSALPYSIESVGTYSISRRLQIIADLKDVDEGLKDSYLFCKSLNLTFAQILGLDQNLIQYVKPNEFRILFDLIYEQLDRGGPVDCREGEKFVKTGLFKDECCGSTGCYSVGDRPEGLNKLLYYLYETTPSDILSELSNGQPGLLADLATLLNTTLAAKIQSLWPDANTQIAELIFGNGLLSSISAGQTNWLDIQAKFLKETPLNLLAKYLDKKLPPLTDGESVMSKLAENSVLGEPYLDTLGKWTGLDRALFTTGQEAYNKANQWVEAGVNKGLDVVQDSLEVVILQWPKDAAKALARFFGIGVGEDASNQLAGSCRAVSGESECVLEAGEVYREIAGRKECCNMGSGVVCQAKCRDIPEAGCDELLGESEENGQCCYETEKIQGIDFCIKCRKINADAGGKCRTNDGGDEIEKPKTKKVGGRVYTLCCRKEQCQDNKTQCCTSVMECIMNKFSAHLEALADMLADGEVPLSNLRFRK